MHESIFVSACEHGANVAHDRHTFSPPFLEIHNVLTPQINDVPFLYARDFSHRCCKYEVSKELLVEAWGRGVYGEYLLPLNDGVSNAITLY